MGRNHNQDYSISPRNLELERREEAQPEAKVYRLRKLGEVWSIAISKKDDRFCDRKIFKTILI